MRIVDECKRSNNTAELAWQVRFAIVYCSDLVKLKQDCDRVIDDLKNNEFSELQIILNNKPGFQA